LVRRTLQEIEELRTPDAQKKDMVKLNKNFNITELDQILYEVKRNSSPGIDTIPYELYINAPKSLKELLLKLINNSWNLNEIPQIWKTAIVCPVYKPLKDRYDPKSYRPISLTSTSCKIMEKMIANRLRWYLEKNRLLHKSQSGFRIFCSTNDAIARLKVDAENSINGGNFTIALMIDFSRAFDVLWVDGLLLKLRKLNITGNVFWWIKNFLQDRNYVVKLNEAFSDPYTLDNGTPQGSSLSPLLFLIMVNDFPKLSQFTMEALFADDCTI